MFKNLRLFKKKPGRIAASFLSFTLILALVFILTGKILSVSAISSVEGEVFYTSNTNKANIKIAAPTNGDKLAVFTMTDEKYTYTGTQYDITAGSDNVPVDVKVSNEKSMILNVAVIPSGKKAKDFNGFTATQFKDNFTEIKSITIKYDNLPPSAPLITPTVDSSIWTNSNIKIRITAQDDTSGSGIAKLQWKTSEVKSDWQDYDDNNRPIINNNVTVYARAIDKAGLYTDNSLEIKNIDIDKPIILEDSIVKDDNSWNADWIKRNETFTVKFKINDNLSGIKGDSVNVKVGNITIPAVMTAESGGFYTAKFTAGIGEGQINLTENKVITYEINGKDLAGNPALSKTGNSLFKCDVTAPAISGISLKTYDRFGFERRATKNIKNGDRVIVSFKAADNGIGIEASSIKATINGIIKDAVWNGIHYEAKFIVGTDINAGVSGNSLVYNMEAKDLAGNKNVTIAQNTSFIFDETAPVFSKATILKDNTSKTDAWVKDEDTITVKFKLEDPSGIDDSTVKVTIGSQSIIATALTGTDKEYYTAQFTIGTGNGKVNTTENSTFSYTVAYSDNLGNADTKTGNSTFKYDNTAPTYSDFTIKKDDISKTADWVTKGDTFTVRFKLDDNGMSGIKNDSVKVTIDGITNTAKPLTGSEAGYYTAQFTVGSEAGQVDTVENNTFAYTIDYSDIAGNTGQKNGASEFKYNYSPPSFSDFTMTKDNGSITSDWVKNNDTFTIKFKLSSNGLSDINNSTVKVTVGGVQVLATPLSGTDLGFYTAQFTIGSGAGQVNTAENGTFSYVIDYSNIVGNADKKSGESSFKYDCTEPVLSNLTILKDNLSKTSDWVKNGDTFTVKFNLNDNGLSGVKDDTVKVTIDGIEKTAIPLTGNDLGYYSVQFTVGTGAGEVDTTESKTFPYTINYSDTVGNVSQKTGTSEFRYDCTAPVLSSFSMTKDDTTKTTAWVKNNDTFTVKFKLDDNNLSSVDNTSVKITVNKVEVTAEPLTGNDSGYYTAQFKVGTKEGEVSTQENASFAYTIDYSDIVGNVEKKEGTSSFKYDTAAPVYSDFNINKTSGANMNTPSMSVVRNGDKFKVSFNLEDGEGSSINDATVRVKLVNNQEVTAKKTGSNYCYEFEVNKDYTGTENEIVKVEYVKFSDIVGNEDIYNLEKDSKFNTSMKYYAPIANGLTINRFDSNNVNKGILQPNVAKNGDLITLKFATTHPVIISEALFEGKSAKAITSDDGMNWTAVYEIAGFTQDRTNVSFTLKINDLAANDQVGRSEADVSTHIEYYAPITVNNLKMATNNSNNGEKYAKDGDTVTVSFKTNHEVKLSNVKIAEKEISTNSIKTVNSSGNIYDWTIAYTLKNGDVADLSNVTFNFDVDDLSGNTTVNKKHMNVEAGNSITYFVPITANVSISSNNVNTTYAKNGSTIAIRLKTNHNTAITSSTIFSRGTDNAGNNSMNLTASYILPGGEGALEEGVVPFNIIIADEAGNTLNISDTNDSQKSKITYDRTNPTVVIGPDFSGFSNKALDYNITFADKNLYAPGLSLTINGEEQLTAEDRNSITQGASTYTKTIKVDNEGIYNIEATVMDFAENKSAPNGKVSLTVDKTNPKVTSTKINLEKPMTFKKGFIISKFFNIDEKYVGDIICKVTDNAGANDWDIDTPINTEGKKTIYLLVTDKAGNSSQALTYDLYIDGTAPKPIIKDKVSGRGLVPGVNKESFLSQAILNISLDKIHIGSEEEDKFTKLQLLDKDGNVVKDLLKEASPVDGVYTLELKKYGDYKLLVEAKDGALPVNSNAEAGNKIENMEYSFSFKDKTVVVKYYENKPLFYTSISTIIVLIGIFVTVMLLKRKNHDENIKA